MRFFWSLVILSLLVHIFCVSSTPLYNCENGVFDSLLSVTEKCRMSSYIISLRSMRKEQSHISGRDIVDLFRDYCRVVQDVSNCVEGMVNFLPCLQGHMEQYLTLNNRSNAMCVENELSETIVNIYKDLPMESLNYRENKCYREAPSLMYGCVRRYLDVGPPNTTRKVKMKKTFNSLRCTFRKLVKLCSRDTALILTTFEYDWLILPPAFGINVTETLLTVAKLKFS